MFPSRVSFWASPQRSARDVAAAIPASRLKRGPAGSGGPCPSRSPTLRDPRLLVLLRGLPGAVLPTANTSTGAGADRPTQRRRDSGQIVRGHLTSPGILQCPAPIIVADPGPAGTSDVTPGTPARPAGRSSTIVRRGLSYNARRPVRFRNGRCERGLACLRPPAGLHPHGSV